MAFLPSSLLIISFQKQKYGLFYSPNFSTLPGRSSSVFFFLTSSLIFSLLLPLSSELFLNCSDPKAQISSYFFTGTFDKYLSEIRTVSCSPSTDPQTQHDMIFFPWKLNLCAREPQQFFSCFPILPHLLPSVFFFCHWNLYCLGAQHQKVCIWE